MAKYIQYIPKPLLDDLIQNKWLPIVGAGFSRNAIVPRGKTVPLWEDLGRALADEMPDYPYSGALDAISSYAYEYSRAKLVERLFELLLVDQARPGDAHKAFCSVQFDTVCTTNFDFLLERQYETTPRYCRPVVDEDQLSITIRDSAVTLLKLHGDLHHPQRLIVTEDDYDTFLEKYPVLATHLADLLITRTAVLVGYSLDDPDFRQVWQIVGERLGRLRRAAYSIMVDARPAEIGRFERRGVKVINLPGPRGKYSDILSTLFDELQGYLSAHIIPASEITEEEPLRELSLPQDAPTRLCFFAVPFSLHSFYKDQVFPVAERFGFVPITADDVVSPGDNIVAKIDALIARSSAVVVDLASSNTLFEMRLALSPRQSKACIVVVEENLPIPIDLHGLLYFKRSSNPFAEPEDLLGFMEKAFSGLAESVGPRLTEEPKRLLDLREYRAAVTSAVSLLEIELRQNLAEQIESRRVTPIVHLIQVAQRQELFDKAEADRIQSWLKIRNAIVHTQQTVQARKAREIVEGVLVFIEHLRNKQL